MLQPHQSAVGPTLIPPSLCVSTNVCLGCIFLLCVWKTSFSKTLLFPSDFPRQAIRSPCHVKHAVYSIVHFLLVWNGPFIHLLPLKGRDHFSNALSPGFSTALGSWDGVIGCCEIEQHMEQKGKTNKRNCWLVLKANQGEPLAPNISLSYLSKLASL